MLRAALAVAMFAIAPCTSALAQYKLYDINSGSNQTSFGWSTCISPDIDSDGVSDVVVGSPNDDTPQTNSGSVSVYSGASGLLLLKIGGTSLGDHLGSSVSGAGDVNMDGFVDIAAGAYGANSDSGIGYAFSGTDGAQLLMVAGTGLGDQLGRSCDGGEDINGDGFDDVVFGAHFADPSALLTNAGAAVVASGADSSMIHYFTGSQSGDELGVSVVMLDDVNNDGAPDLLIGAPYSDPGGVSEAGQARIYSGSNGLLLKVLNGDVSGRQFGYYLARVLDLDDDSIDDFVISGSNSTATVFSGSDQTALFSFNSNNSSVPRVSDGGDVDGNGTSDIIMGIGSSLSVFSGVGGQLLLKINGQNSLGNSVFGGADLNADGLADFGGGAPSDESVSVWSYPGLSAGASTYGTGCPNPSGLIPDIDCIGGEPTTSIGNPSFGIHLSNTEPGQSGLLLFGASFQAVDLAAVGLPGCVLNVSPDVLLPATTTGQANGLGIATIVLGIPNAPQLAGFLAHFQWYVSDGASLVPGSMSKGLQLLVL